MIPVGARPHRKVYRAVTLMALLVYDLGPFLESLTLTVAPQAPVIDTYHL